MLIIDQEIQLNYVNVNVMINQTQFEKILEIIMRSEATIRYKLQLIDALRIDYKEFTKYE